MITSSGSHPAASPVVLFVSLDRGVGGPAASLATVLETLNGDVIRVVAYPGGGRFSELDKSRQLSDVWLPLSPWKRARRLGRGLDALRIAKWVRGLAEKPAAIHVNTVSALIVSALTARSYRLKTVVWAHASSMSSMACRLATVAGWLAGRVEWVAVSGVARDALAACGISPERISVVPNPIDREQLLVGRGLATSATPVIGYLGAASPVKGFDLLPRVIGLLGPATRWVIFTGTAKSKEMGEVRQELKQQPTVTLSPLVADIRDALGLCDIVICPSRQESFGRVVAEAMVNGIPVVASDIPAFRALVGHEEAGLLFPVGDAKAAASAILRLAGDTALRQRLGGVGKDRAAEYSPALVVQKLLDLYET